MDSTQLINDNTYTTLRAIEILKMLKPGPIMRTEHNGDTCWLTKFRDGEIVWCITDVIMETEDDLPPFEQIPQAALLDLIQGTCQWIFAFPDTRYDLEDAMILVSVGRSMTSGKVMISKEEGDNPIMFDHAVTEAPLTHEQMVRLVFQEKPGWRII